MTQGLFADESMASETDEPRAKLRRIRSKDGASEEIRERMERMKMKSGGLGDRDDDFVRPLRREPGDYYDESHTLTAQQARGRR